MRFEHVLVVGAGQMGGGIAQVIATSGRRVSLYDEVPGAVDRALGAMRRSLEKLAQKGGADPAEVLARVSPTDGLVPADLMIEAVVETPKACRGKRLSRVRLEPDSDAVLNKAAYACMEGVAEPEAIDTIARLGFAHPLGPLALADLIGLDTCPPRRAW